MYICAFRKRIHTFKHYIYKVVVAVRVGVQTRLVIVVGARRQGARGGKAAAARHLCVPRAVSVHLISQNLQRQKFCLGC